MHTQTILDRIEIEPQTGNIAIRMLKQIADEHGTVLASAYHRTSIAANADPATQMAAVNEHLVTMGYPALSESDMTRIAAVTAAGR